MSATIKQVAERAGVSTATVSYVLNGTGTVTEATRQRVLDAVAALDYRPSYAARSLRGRSRTLGLALPALPGRLADPVLAEVLAGIADAAAQRGYALLLAAPDSDQPADAHCLDLARTGRVDGLVLLDVESDDARARALCGAGVAHVCAGAPPEGCGSPSAAVDLRAGAGQAVAHLVGLGHRRIGLILPPSNLVSSATLAQGFTEALAQAGLPAEDTLVVETERSEQDGYQAMQELLSLPEPPSAVLAGSDELAFGALHALYDAGLEAGRQASLIGFDDVPLAAHVRPALTCFRQPRYRLGQELAGLLVGAIEQPAPQGQQTVLQGRLIVRRSTAPNPPEL
jgi:LacI family transcriptional regulator/LacI family repressor for deo operon, udp, cdd, tsx, nupC, and nupG